MFRLAYRVFSATIFLTFLSAAGLDFMNRFDRHRHLPMPKRKRPRQKSGSSIYIANSILMWYNVGMRSKGGRRLSMQTKYKIRTLSARAIIGYAEESDDRFVYCLSRSATVKCISRGASELQDDCALFYQIMLALNREPRSTQRVITDLSDILFFVDFDRIFSAASSPRGEERARKAESMFRPEGITLDFGSGPHPYVAFERSGSMSRQARLSFLRADIVDEVRRRIMLDMEVGRCQLSKLYAYNGLMLSGGTRIDGLDVFSPHRVIVVDNPKYSTNARVITVEGGALRDGMKSYRRVETRKTIDVTRFDGEGLISKQYAKAVDKKLCGKHIHSSFQIRLPFVKGMLHEVDFKDFLTSAGCSTVTDIFGVSHPVSEVEIILTKSMFKGYGWLTENGMTWDDYLTTLLKYDHALYVTGTNKPRTEGFTELNYQFLCTLSMTAEEFRPADLPDGWDHAPSDDPRNWITKATEQRYYDLTANPDTRIRYFSEQDTPLGRAVKKNPLLVNEPVCTKELADAAEHVMDQYVRGRLIVAGDNRYLSGDLLELLILLMEHPDLSDHGHEVFFKQTFKQAFSKNAFYSPGAAYRSGRTCTLLRNPHIARNEEICLTTFGKPKQMRKHYLGHLHGVVMVDAAMLAAERLGGADYDGDMIKTIADPLVNECVSRNYEFDRLDNIDNLPLLYIPAEEPVIRDARDWHDRFVTVQDTFSSRVGQICNAAFRRSIVAYDENSDAKARQKAREETETLAILTGLEIDSAKSGVKPDLSAYLGRQKGGSNSVFLQYKALLDDDGDNAWYEPTAKQKMKHFINATDWNAVTSNVERLPYLAEMLRKNTPKIKGKPAKDSDLFAFAEAEGWKDKLDPVLLSSASDLIRDYEAVLNRIRTCRAPIKQKTKQSDIDRILYARGQEEDWDSDELYAGLSELSPERVSEIRKDLTVHSWHLMDADERLGFLGESLPEFEEYFGLFSDFRAGGYRILGDLICDIDDENRATDRKELFRDQDSPAFSRMMWAYVESASSQYYRSAVAAECRELLTGLVKPKNAVRVLVALGKRNLLWELIPDLAVKEVKRYAQ